MIKLDKTIDPAWDTANTPGTVKAAWDAVNHASGYSVQLYKGVDASGSPVSVTALVTEYDFTAAINETGVYTFKVRAVGKH